MFKSLFNNQKSCFAMFEPRTYLKSELAMLYAPDCCIDTAVKTFIDGFNIASLFIEACSG